MNQQGRRSSPGESAPEEAPETSSGSPPYDAFGVAAAASRGCPAPTKAAARPRRRRRPRTRWWSGGGASTRRPGAGGGEEEGVPGVNMPQGEQLEMPMPPAGAHLPAGVISIVGGVVRRRAGLVGLVIAHW